MRKSYLNDGAYLGLSEGAQMTTVASFNEILDNFFGKNASKINITYDSNKKYLEFMGMEENDLTEDIAFDKLYGLGVGSQMSTQDNGVGKYNQGFKYSVAQLIGNYNKGTVRIDSIPDNGNPWALKQIINYTGENYTDQIVLDKEDGIEYEELESGYNFRIVIDGCREISNRELLEIEMVIGLRYRDKIENGNKIYLNGQEVLSQDRLYLFLPHSRVQYKCEYLSYKDNTNAAKFEYVDLESARIDQTELCRYDTINGRKKGVTCTIRGGVEVVFNGVTVIYENLPTEFRKLCTRQFQPGAAGFRGRLTIFDKNLYDEYFCGGNKSAVSTKDGFNTSKDTVNIVRALKNAYQTYCDTHNIKEDKIDSRYNDVIESVIKSIGFGDIEVKFQNRGEDFITFDYDDKIQSLTVNEGAKLFNTHKSSDLFILTILHLINIPKPKTFGDVLKVFKKIDYEIG